MSNNYLAWNYCSHVIEIHVPTVVTWIQDILDFCKQQHCRFPALYDEVSFLELEGRSYSHIKKSLFFKTPPWRHFGNWGSFILDEMVSHSKLSMLLKDSNKLLWQVFKSNQVYDSFSQAMKSWLHCWVRRMITTTHI